MSPGMLTTVAPGDYEDFLLDFIPRDDGSGNAAIVPLMCASGYGDTFWVIGCDRIPQHVVFIPEGLQTPIHQTVFYDVDQTTHKVFAFPLGDWDNFADIDPTFTAAYFESDKGKSAKIDFQPTMEIVEANNDLDQLSSWSLTGIERFATGRPIRGEKTKAKIDIQIENAGGTYTVILSCNGWRIASGSRVGNGIVTLTQENNSGVSGQVTIAFTAELDETDEAYVVGRWAKSYAVTCGSGSATVNDPGRGEWLTCVVGPLTSGVNNISITPTSDTNVAGTARTSSITIPGRPEPPGALTVVAGGTFNSTDVQFTASSTSGATYRLYESEELDGPINHSEPTDLHIAGTGAITWRIPNIASGTGKRRLYIVAVDPVGNMEDMTRRSLTIEYLSGNVVSPRPNRPGFNLRYPDPVTSRAITCEYTYNTEREPGTATKLKMFILDEGETFGIGEDVDPSTDPADAEVTFDVNNKIDGFYTGTISATAGSNGWKRVVVIAETAGGAQSDNTDPTPAVYVSNAVMAAVPNTITVSVVG